MRERKSRRRALIHHQQEMMKRQHGADLIPCDVIIGCAVPVCPRRTRPAQLLKPSCLWCSGDRDGSSTDRGGELSIPRSSLRTSIKHQGQLPPTWSLSGWRESKQNKKKQNKNKNRLTTGRKITTEWDYFSLITTAALHFPGNVGCERSWDTLTGTILDLKKIFLIVN